MRDESFFQRRTRVEPPGKERRVGLGLRESTPDTPTELSDFFFSRNFGAGSRGVYLEVSDQRVRLKDDRWCFGASHGPRFMRSSPAGGRTLRQSLDQSQEQFGKTFRRGKGTARVVRTCAQRPKVSMCVCRFLPRSNISASSLPRLRFEKRWMSLLKSRREPRRASFELSRSS